MKSIGIIPARFASSRFPGKPLIDIAGKTMIQRVYEQVLKADLLQEVIVATDDMRIFDHVLSFGGKVKMTDLNHQSGTDRCAEVADSFSFNTLIVNIQGDEPFIDPRQINQLVELMKSNMQFGIGTLCKKIEKVETIFDPNTVKVVFDKNEKALFFSRNPIPFVRGEENENWINKHCFYKHIGMYAYRKNVLLEIAQLEQSSFELAESLEQLRWLQNAYTIGIGITKLESVSIDTPEDLEKLIG